MALALAGNGDQKFESSLELKPKFKLTPKFKFKSKFKSGAELNSGAVVQSDTVQKLGFDPTTSAGLELAASIYFVPENELLYRMRFPDGAYREFQKRYAYSTRPIQELWSQHGWTGLIREKEGLIFVKSGTNVEGGEVQFLFKNGRLIQFEQNGKVFKIPYDVPRKPTQGGLPYFFSNGTGSRPNSSRSSTKRQSSGKQAHTDRIYDNFNICHIDKGGNVSILLKRSAGCPLSGAKIMEGEVPILIMNGQARVNGDNPDIWIVDDRTLGGVLACGDIRWYYHSNPAAPAVGYVLSVEDLPRKRLKRLVLAGESGVAWLDWLKQSAENKANLEDLFPEEVVFILPILLPSELPQGLFQSCKVKYVIGEILTRYNRKEFSPSPTWVTVVPGMELYVKGWMDFVME